MEAKTESFGTGGSRRERGPKGRALDDVALGEIRALLGDRPRRRDLLIEFLHLIQDRWGFLNAARLRALAEEMRLSQAEVYEVASFYDHFDIVKEGAAPPPPLTIRVCGSISCALAGSEALIHSLQAAVNPEAVRVLHAPCMGRCAGAPAARAGDREIERATHAALLAMAGQGDTAVNMPSYVALDAYRRSGGYQLLGKVRSGALSVADVIDAIEKSGLKGLGGAGFPAGKKWGFVRSYLGPRLMTVNGDEGEPGTFKDRAYLENDPHRTLEGAMIAAHAVEAERIYVYMRDEYPAVLNILRREIAALEERWRRRAGLHRIASRSRRLHLRRRKRDDRKHRRQTWPSASPAALHRGGRPVRAPNAQPQCRDLVVDTRHCGEGPGSVRGAGQARPSRFALLVRVGACRRSRRQARAGGRHGTRTHRRLLRRDGAGPRVQGVFARRGLGRNPAGVDGGRAARLRRRTRKARRVCRIARDRRFLRP